MSDEKPGDFACWGVFEVSRETPASAEPSEGALDNPASGQELEAFDAGRSLYNLNGPFAATGESIDKLLSAIDPVGKDMLKPGKTLSQAFQQRHGSMNILNVCGMDVDGQKKPIGINDNVALAPINTLTGVKAPWTTGLCCRSTLAVDDSSGRRWLTPKFSPRSLDQSSDDPVPPAGVAPIIEIALDRGVWWELAWQSSPLAARRRNIKNCPHDLAQIDLARAAPVPSRWHLPGNQRPLRIGQVACIAQPIAQILDTSGFGPRHRALPRIFANPKESQPAEITHSFFGQALRMRADRETALKQKGRREAGLF
jgi:hypothetical protein